MVIHGLSGHVNGSMIQQLLLTSWKLGMQRKTRNALGHKIIPFKDMPTVTYFFLLEWFLTPLGDEWPLYTGPINQIFYVLDIYIRIPNIIIMM